MKNKIKWLDMPKSHPSPYVTLCKTQKEFDKALKKLKHPTERFVPQGANAVVHIYKDTGGSALCIVCIDLAGACKKKHRNQIYSILVHEAVHIWQIVKEEMHEEKPSVEFEAYTIQWIAQQLFYEVYPK